MDFSERLCLTEGGPLKANGIGALQANLGPRCNLSCTYCHIGAGPSRGAGMSRETAGLVLDALEKSPIGVLDLTGGSPEMNPNFRTLVREARAMGREVIVRTNLAVYSEPGMNEIPRMLADKDVHIIASLPSYIEDHADRMRGRGTFRKCVSVLKTLNVLGYGSGLRLDLAHNPSGAFLPPPESALEGMYRAALRDGYGIGFDRLLAFANMPIGRFGESLKRAGGFSAYMETLESAFNPATIRGLMCRSLISVGWDGGLFDCDFNHALGIGIQSGMGIRDFDYGALSGREIAVGGHCYACSAGQGFT